MDFSPFSSRIYVTCFTIKTLKYITQTAIPPHRQRQGFNALFFFTESGNYFWWKENSRKNFFQMLRMVSATSAPRRNTVVFASCAPTVVAVPSTSTSHKIRRAYESKEHARTKHKLFNINNVVVKVLIDVTKLFQVNRVIFCICCYLMLCLTIV